MRLSLSLAALALLPAGWASARPATTTADRIAAVENGLRPAVRVRGRETLLRLADRMAHHRVPGLSVAVIDGGRIDWAKGYGVQDVDSRAPVTPETLFQAASISKPVAALAALRLVEAGRIDLDGDVNRWLTSWKLPENELTRERKVTLRGILSHTAGLTVHGFPGYPAGAALPRLPQILDGVPPAATAAVRVDRPPGQGFRYSGGGTTLMQQLLVDVTTRPFPELMRESVLRPLGMSRSTYEQPLPEPLHASAATGHDRTGRAVPGKWHVYPEMAAAGLWTTPSELALFALELQKAYAGRSRKLISEATAKAMLSPQQGAPAGLGPLLEGADESSRFLHGGSNEGFRCQLVAYLSRGQGAVVMTNSDGGAALVQELLDGIAAAYDWPGFLPAEKVVASVEPAAYERLVGQYQMSPHRALEVRREGDRLFVLWRFGEKEELLPESPSEFFVASSRIGFRFLVDEQGRASAVLVRQGTSEVLARRRR
jgi:CubicO group peptidase (beta-lactamase class C family)